ncbi:hypothetical protein ACIBF1_08785 [Spirillospora sp. NPDC050679]
METEDMVEVWRTVVLGDDKSWVLFENGTCVIVLDHEGDLAERATEILREYGPVYAGSPAADFGTIDLQAAPGWAVYGHHPEVLTYVAPDEVEEDDDFRIGLLGRSKRDLDGRDLRVVHVEDRR